MSRPWLVLRGLGLGDALTAVPALRALRRATPHRPILLAAPVGIGTLLRDYGLVDGVVDTNGLAGAPPGLLLGDHDAINMHGIGPRSHRLLLAARPGRLVAYPNPAVGNDGPPWHPQEHEVLRWVRLIEHSIGGSADPADLRLFPPEPRDGRRQGPIVIHPGASEADRRWPVPRWAAVAMALSRRGIPVVVTGSSAERPLARRIVAYARSSAYARNSATGPAATGPADRLGIASPGICDLSGRTDLPELVELVRGATAVLSTDTGLAHVATACCTPSVVLFGPQPPSRWGPLIDCHLHRVLRADGRDLPREGCTGSRTRRPPHPSHTGRSRTGRPDPHLSGITVGAVLRALAALPVPLGQPAQQARSGHLLRSPVPAET